MALHSKRFCLMLLVVCGPTTSRQHVIEIWALPFSLATTRGIIIIFFSTGYLDVSVLQVGFSYCYEILCLQHSRLSHSEIRGFNACMQLPSAYRSLPRPSSPPRAKASAMCPCQTCLASCSMFSWRVCLSTFFFSCARLIVFLFFCSRVHDPCAIAGTKSRPLEFCLLVFR